jgi:hypothetical protein
MSAREKPAHETDRLLPVLAYTVLLAQPPEFTASAAEATSRRAYAIVAEHMPGVGVPSLTARIGTIEAGKRADLIVVDGNPLRSIREIRNLRAVITNGRMFDTAALWRSVGFTP